MCVYSHIAPRTIDHKLRGCTEELARKTVSVVCRFFTIAEARSRRASTPETFISIKFIMSSVYEAIKTAKP